MGSMKRWTMGLLIAALMVTFAGLSPGQAGGVFGASQATSLVNDRGILFGEPEKYRTMFDDFDVLNTALWDTTSFFGEVVTVPDSSATGSSFYLGRPLILETLAAAQDVARLRWNGQGFQLYANKPLEFETRIAVEDTTHAVLIVGLTAKVDSLAGVARYATNGVYFKKKLANGTFWAFREKTAVDSTWGAATGRIPKMTWTKLKIVWNGSYLRYYVNDKIIKSTTTTTKPEVSLFPLIELRANTAAIRKVYVDYVLVRQRR